MTSEEARAAIARARRAIAEAHGPVVKYPDAAPVRRVPPPLPSPEARAALWKAIADVRRACAALEAALIEYEAPQREAEGASLPETGNESEELPHA